MFEKHFELASFAQSMVGGSLDDKKIKVLKTIENNKNIIVVTHKHFDTEYLVALTVLLMGMLNPGMRIGVFSSSFRRPRIVFEHIDKIVSNNFILQSCSTGQPVITNDMCSFSFNQTGIGQSFIRSFSVNDISRLHGQRFHRIFIVDACYLPEDVFNEVIRPMTASSVDPIEAARREQFKSSVIDNSDLSPRTKTLVLEELDNKDYNLGRIILFTQAHYKHNWVYNLMNSGRYATISVPASDGCVYVGKHNRQEIQFRMEHFCEWVEYKEEK
jgi:hypothetical protein